MGEGDFVSTDADRLVVTRPQLARLFDVSAARISKYVVDGMPCQSAGRGKSALFDVALCFSWRSDRQSAPESSSARDEYYRAQTRKVEIEIRVRERELVEAGEVEHLHVGLIVAARERLLSLPGSALQIGIVDDSGESELIRIVDEALSELSTDRTPILCPLCSGVILKRGESA
jgi:hypothetical protein